LAAKGAGLGSVRLGLRVAAGAAAMDEVADAVVPEQAATLHPLFIPPFLSSLLSPPPPPLPHPEQSIGGDGRGTCGHEPIPPAPRWRAPFHRRTPRKPSFACEQRALLRVGEPLRPGRAGQLAGGRVVAAAPTLRNGGVGWGGLTAV
jgi:hypothetical protein